MIGFSINLCCDVSQVVVGAARELGEQAPEKAEQLARATEDTAAQVAPQVEETAGRVSKATHLVARETAQSLPKVCL